MGRGGWVAPGVFIDPTAGANKKAQLRPLCYYSGLIKCLKNRFTDGHNLIPYSSLFMFLGQVFRTCYSWAYIYIIHCF